MLRDKIYFFFATELNFAGQKKDGILLRKQKRGSFYMMIILHGLNLNNWNFLIKKAAEFFFGEC